MIEKIICVVKGEYVQVAVPEGASEVIVMMQGTTVSIEPPNEHCTEGTIAVGVAMNRLSAKTAPPMVLLSAYDSGDNDMCLWKTQALMYITGNGRIMGKNQTLGYANNEKPLAPKPWYPSQKPTRKAELKPFESSVVLARRVD